MGSQSEKSSGALEHIEAPMTIYPMVEVVARLEAWKLEFRGSPCLAKLGCSEIAHVHAKNFEKCGPHRQCQL